MEAYEEYWRKVPSVKRIVFQSIPEATTRLAMLKRGEVDVAYLLEGSLAQTVKSDPKLKLAFSGGIGTLYPRLLRHVGSEIAVGRPARAQGREPRDGPEALSEAETLGASKPNGNIALEGFEFALPIEPDPMTRRAPRSCSRKLAIPMVSMPASFIWPPYVGTGEAITGTLAPSASGQGCARPSGRRFLRR